jgi:hypothetical protein
VKLGIPPNGFHLLLVFDHFGLGFEEEDENEDEEDSGGSREGTPSPRRCPYRPGFSVSQ